MERALTRHLKDNLGLYLLVGFFFLAGIITGTIAVNFLEPQQVSQLGAYLDKVLSQFKGEGPGFNQAAYQALLGALRETGLIWFLGLTVIGIPLIIGLIFLKGLILGFTVGFLVQQKALQGMAFSFLALLPPNIIQIPALFIAAILGISFSIGLMRGRGQAEAAILPRFLTYSFLMLLVTLVLVGGGLVEGYLSPFFARIVLAYF
ncbi:stage II sporulation protein M [Neomoorella thermoacetica]|uniref:Stage II sporulation protein M n=2 Tax=Neomoorella thermoacetica TaxID=1525 RepID=A0A1D7XBH6_NEOTH|nr:stage II sporulation protein M [Moorella thermoacetica]AKX94286.1 stage II sporulation protein M [Moorella thermoacetica]AKX96924.1 stage II sporulation protein M [Moorella thermoacetica]AOQ24234.1 Stage II sporulation protein M [Moorella thermoacetica]OIQ11039.1 stage II sporulation protein M [Moorella thermoacetica]OIQ54399.1 stage II sporulation protein M [Moorella thermoacetica]